jgi:hypothetical protein
MGDSLIPAEVFLPASGNAKIFGGTRQVTTTLEINPASISL